MIHQHGGDLDAIEKQYHIPKKEIIDFSGNINPFGFPASVKKSLVQNLDILSVYPDKNYTTLRKAIANYTGADFEQGGRRLKCRGDHYYGLAGRKCGGSYP